MPETKLGRRHTVGRVDEIPPGKRKIVEVDGRSIGVFNVDGAFYALLNRCPHQAAPLCQGNVIRSTLPSNPGEYRMREKADILRCPWHGWEFHIPSGESVFDPFRCKVRTYDVTVEPMDTSADVGDGAQNSFVATDDDDGEWPKAETYPVTVESDRVILHLPGRGDKA